MWNRTENQITFVMIRHGFTKSNEEHRYLGKSDEALSEQGIAVLEAKRISKKYPEVERLFVSPMKRCLETAQILYPQKEAVVISEWEEMDFGEFEGKNYEQLEDDARYQKWIDSNGTLPFPGGESREEFVERCVSGFRKLLKLLGESNGRSIGMIVHGGTIMALLSHFYGGEYFDYQVQNGEGYQCLWKETEAGWQLIPVKRL